MMTNEQHLELIQCIKLLALEMRETKTLVIDAIADIADVQARVEAVNQRFDE